MIQVKIIDSFDLDSLNDKINSFLAGISSEAVKDISVNSQTLTTVIQYEVKDAWVGHLCVDCQSWDDSGSHNSVVGLCQQHGGRKRFNCSACPQFTDVRE